MAILASGSVLLVQSPFESFLPWRARSSRTRSSIVGVSTPRHCRGARSPASQRWPPSSNRRRRSSRLSPSHARRRSSGQIRTLSHEVHAAGGYASSIATNDRELFPDAPTAKTPATTANQISARRCLARCLSLRNNRSCACENSAQAATMARPSFRHRTVCRSARRRHRTGLVQKLLQTIVENMARRTRHLRPCHQEVALNLALTPHRHCRSRPESFYDRQTESADDDFVNGLLG